VKGVVENVGSGDVSFAIGGENSCLFSELF